MDKRFYYNPIKSERVWTMFLHLLGAFFGILGPLVFWVARKDRSMYVHRQGKEALNFHLSIIIYSVIITLISLLFSSFFLLYILGAILGLYFIILVILATVATFHGEDFRYPFTIKIMK